MTASGMAASDIVSLGMAAPEIASLGMAAPGMSTPNLSYLLTLNKSKTY